MYAIMRFKKLKSWGEIGGVGNHHSRDRATPNANASIPNLWLKKPVGGIVEGVRDRLSGIKIRKNAVLGYEFLMTASPEFFRSDDGEVEYQKVVNFSRKAMAWLKEIFGSENIISSICHLDEQTPHIQAVVVPIDARGKINACHWTGDRKKLQALQDSFAEKLAPLDLERGIKGSRASHTRISEYYSSVNTSVPPALPEIKVEIPPFLLTESAREDWAAEESQRLNQEIRPRLQPLADRSAALKLERKRREEAEILLLESRKKAKDDSRVREQEDAAMRRKADHFDFLSRYAPGALFAALLTAQEAREARLVSSTIPDTDAGGESCADTSPKH